MVDWFVVFLVFLVVEGIELEILEQDEVVDEIDEVEEEEFMLPYRLTLDKQVEELKAEIDNLKENIDRKEYIFVKMYFQVILSGTTFLKDSMGSSWLY